MKDDWLIADIGATNARFARVRGGSMKKVLLPTTGYTRADALLDAAMAELGMDTAAAACMAIAGPVTGGSGYITNLGIEFDPVNLTGRLGCEVLIVNDFHALAHAVPWLERLHQLGGSAVSEPGAVRALLGPGSGLGMSVLVPPNGTSKTAADDWRVLDSEGGHADIAPGNPLESEVLNLLPRIAGSVCWEAILSGPGLVNLYRCICEIWGAQPDALAPADVTRLGVSVSDPICHQTLELFFAWLGTAAGNLALTVCARGGVYIGGGIVPALVDFAQTSALRRRFDERCSHQDFVPAIPLYIILDDDPGLLGARVCLEKRLAAR